MANIVRSISTIHNRMLMGHFLSYLKTTHEKYRYTNALHPHLPEAHPYHPVDKDAFNIDREQYWKDRAANERAARSRAANLSKACK